MGGWMRTGQLTLVIAAGLLGASMASATPGGVDANGCHKSDKIGLHCHPMRKTTVPAPKGAKSETPAEREKRLKKECKGKPVGGQCTKEWTGTK